jgi:hypothetical protein
MQRMTPLEPSGDDGSPTYPLRQILDTAQPQREQPMEPWRNAGRSGPLARPVSHRVPRGRRTAGNRSRPHPTACLRICLAPAAPSTSANSRTRARPRQARASRTRCHAAVPTLATCYWPAQLARSAKDRPRQRKDIMGRKDVMDRREGAVADLPAVKVRGIAVRGIAAGGVALRALAAGALAAGAAAIGAFAIGAVAVGRLRVGNAAAKKLSVGRLEVDELVIGGKPVRVEDLGL